MKKQLLILTTTLISLAAFAQVPSYVPTNGLVGYWPFNGNANDESGNNNNGTVNGIVPFISDRNGVSSSAMQGGQGYITIASSFFNFNYTDSFSISLWFTQSTNSSGRIISTENPEGQFRISTYGSGINAFQFGNSLNYIYDTISDLLWHNYIFSFNNGIATKFVDGVNEGSFSLNNQELLSYGYPFTIGAKAAPSFDKWDGKIDDIGIWNRALSQCEIQNLYASQLNLTFVSAGIDESICNGEQVTLTASGSQNYSWNNGVVDGAPFSPTNTLDYIVTADSAGCQSADTLTVFVNQPTNSTLNETALDSYTLNSQTYTQSGTYTQVIPNAAGCDSIITLNLSLDFTGLQELENSFTISPNPATDELTITTNTLLNEKYILFDPQGRKVLSGTLTGTATLLNISQLARGNYLLQIGEKQLPVRIVKN
jgi:hypothetical protein